uniref:Uncharacterized protein n=1 Tax=Brassica campestris TaxID=3711 RepID=M4DQ68_BRACM
MRVLIFQGVGEAIKSLPLRFANRLLLLHHLGTVAAFLEARNIRCAYSQEQGLVADDEQESPGKVVDMSSFGNKATLILELLHP